MKIIDRYVISTFLRNYFISFMVLVGMYVVLDMVFNFNDLVDIRSNVNGGAFESVLGTLKNVADYYFYQSFLFFVQLSGIIPVVAAAFTLMRLSRFNELTAVLAAGVPLLRVAMPIILTAVVLNALLIVDQELVIPNMIPKLVRSHDDLRRGERPLQSVEALQDENRSLLYAAQFTPPTKFDAATLKDLTVIERDESLQPVAKIIADSGEWRPEQRQWALDGGERVAGLRFEELPGKPQRIDGWKTTISPEDITLFGNSERADLLSTRRIDAMLDNPRSYGTLNLLRVKHWRFTQPLMNVILLLLAIPCVLTREPGHLKTAATKCLFLTGIAMGSIFLSHQIAGNPPSPNFALEWPAIMAWMPIFIFGPLSVFLLERVQS